MLKSANARTRLEGIVGGIALMITATTTVGTFTGTILDPRIRPTLLICAALFFWFAAKSSQTVAVTASSLVDASGNPIRTQSHDMRRFVWHILSFVFFCIGVIELGMRLSGLVTLAYVYGPFFQDHSRDYEPWPFKRASQIVDAATGSSGAASSGSWEAYQQRMDIDNFEPAHEIGVNDAVILYRAPYLGEHFTFEIASSGYTSADLLIENIRIHVLQYEAIPKFPVMAGPGDVYNNYIVVMNLDRKTEPLPWIFGAEFLLDDPSKNSVTPWRLKSVHLSDRSQGFIVKLSAKHPGIYTYCADVIVRDKMNVPVPIPLIRETEPRKCMFY